MARPPKLSSEARRQLQQQRRQLQRRAADAAVKRLSSARIQMEKDLNRPTFIALATNDNAFYNTVLSMLTAVRSSWNISNTIHLRRSHTARVEAYTDFREIVINYPTNMTPATTAGGWNPLELRSAIADVKGIGYHEIGHLKFTTPFPVLMRIAGDQGFVLPADLPSRHLQQVWNLLEDQRQEAALVQESPIMVDYLTTMVLNHIVQSYTVYPSQWFLLSGRRYLPGNVRVEVKKEFVKYYGEEPERKGTAIIRRYMKATTAKDMAQAVMDMHLFFGELSISVPPNGDGHGDIYVGSGTPEGDETEVERIASSADNSDDGNQEEPESSNDGDQASDGDSSDGDSSDGDGDSSDSSDSGDGDGDSDGDSDDGTNDDTNGNRRSDTKPNGQRPDREGDSEGNGGSKGEGVGNGRQDDESLEDYIKRIRDLANQQRLTDSSLDSLVRQTYEAAADELVLSKYRDVRPMTNPKKAEEAMNLGRDLEDSLRMYVAENAPIWQNRRERGIIDPFAYRTKVGGSSDYRRLYDNGDLGVDMAVTLVLDTSGSMGMYEDDLGAAAYATKYACDALSIPCTVATFSNVANILWTSTDTPELLNISCGGGTDPTGAMEVTYAFRYDKQTHLIVLMTDGELSSSFKGFGIYKDTGTYILGLGFGSQLYADGLTDKGADESHLITDLLQIPIIVSNFIALRVQ